MTDAPSAVAMLMRQGGRRAALPRPYFTSVLPLTCDWFLSLAQLHVVTVYAPRPASYFPRASLDYHGVAAPTTGLSSS